MSWPGENRTDYPSCENVDVLLDVMVAIVLGRVQNKEHLLIPIVNQVVEESVKNESKSE